MVKNALSCFVICEFGEKDSEARSRADQVFNTLIKPAAMSAGYEVERADQYSAAGIVMDKVIQRIQSADLVVADLTGNNPNVYYEMAIRHFYQMKIISIIANGNTVPFDLRGHEVFHYSFPIGSDARDLDDLLSAIKVVRDQKGIVPNPINSALRLGWGLEEQHPSIERIVNDINNAQERVRIMGMSASNLLESDAIKGALVDAAVNRNVEVQIMMIDPDSDFVMQREKMYWKSRGGETLDYTENVRRQKAVLEELASNSSNGSGQFLAKTYDVMPSTYLIAMDGKTLPGPCYAGLLMTNTPIKHSPFIAPTPAHKELAETLHKNFSDIWTHNKTKAIGSRTVTIVANSPGGLVALRRDKDNRYLLPWLYLFDDDMAPYDIDVKSYLGCEFHLTNSVDLKNKLIVFGAVDGLPDMQSFKQEGYEPVLLEKAPAHDMVISDDVQVVLMFMATSLELGDGE